LALWGELGLRRVCSTPYLMQHLGSEGGSGLSFVGAVGYPFGSQTLGTKRMEALECLRLGGRAVEVVLAHAPVFLGQPGEVEREMAAIRKTVPEMEVLFTVEWSRLSGRAADLLVRVLKSLKPEGLKLGTGLDGDPPSADDVRRLRGRLHRRTGLTLALPDPDPDRVREYLEAGVRWIQTGTPERLVSEPQ